MDLVCGSAAVAAVGAAYAWTRALQVLDELQEGQTGRGGPVVVNSIFNHLLVTIVILL